MISAPITDAWPQSLQEVVAAIGESPTLKLVEAYGGTTQRLPSISNAPEHHFLQVISHAELCSLIQAIGASRDVYIPKCAASLRLSRDQGIVRDYLAGAPVEALARRHNLSDRHIWRILKHTDMRAGLNQPSLF